MPFWMTVLGILNEKPPFGFLGLSKKTGWGRETAGGGGCFCIRDHLKVIYECDKNDPLHLSCMISHRYNLTGPRHRILMLFYLYSVIRVTKTASNIPSHLPHIDMEACFSFPLKGFGTKTPCSELVTQKLQSLIL